MIGSIFLPLTAIILVSFGTTFDDTRAKTIDTLVQDVACYYNATFIEPGFIATQKDTKQANALNIEKTPVILEAYTSDTIINKLKKRGIQKLNVKEALQKAKDIGAKNIIIQPTHLMYGLEYNEIKDLAAPFENDFDAILYGQPLLATKDDIHKLLLTLKKEIPLNKQEALVLMGHGTKTYSNFLYAAIDFQAKQEGFSYVFVCTVEAYPDIECVVASLKKALYKKAVLAPLMLVAGDHANNDMAGDKKDSLKTILEKNNIKTKVILKGLGEYKGIKDIYIDHINCTIQSLKIQIQHKY